MPLMSQSIPNLFNGISQQAAALRLPSQAEEQENAYSTIVDGLQKRYPLVHTAALNLVGDYSTALVKLISFSASERFILVIKGQTIKVFDLLGVEKTVATPDGLTYLNAANSFDTMEVLTVADYTFLLNKEKVTDMVNTPSASETPKGVVWIKNGVQDTDYNIDVNGSVVTYTSGGSGSPATFKTTTIASNLTTLINGLTGYSATRKGSLIEIVQDSGLDFDLATNDSWGDQACVGFKGNVQKFGDLPKRFFEGITLEIIGESKNEEDNMYVHWVANTEGTTGTWKETVKPGLYNDIDATTMPHKLVKEIDGTFTFSKATWDSREVGDTLLAPEPSFIGRTVNNIFFYKNRLGMLSEENIILSRDGGYFNYFPETAANVLDSDPIDLASTNTKISLLEYAVAFDESLLVFSQQTQFTLTHTEILSPKTVSLDVTTEFESSRKAKPVAAGQNLYFAVERDNFSGIREYYVDSEVVSHDAADITAHCPHYIPGNLYLLSSSSNEDIILCVSRDAPNEVYVYKYYWKGSEKIQSSWSKWILDAGDEIIGLSVYDTNVVFVVQRADGVFINTMGLSAGRQDGTLGYLIYLDRKVNLTGAYDAGTGKTTYTLPYEYTGIPQAVTSSDFATNGGVNLNVTKLTNSTFEVPGDYSGGEVIAGVPYTMRYRFSEQFVKDSTDSAVLTAKLMMRNIILSFVNSGFFRVKCYTNYSQQYEYEFTGKILGEGSAILGQAQVASDTFRASIMADSKDAIIEVENDSFMPSQFQSAEWEAMYVIRNSRR